jgi:hypothetical protein
MLAASDSAWAAAAIIGLRVTGGWVGRGTSSSSSTICGWAGT